jgi:hypothetical protein
MSVQRWRCVLCVQVMYEMGEPYKSGVELLSFHTVSKVNDCRSSSV